MVFTGSATFQAAIIFTYKKVYVTAVRKDKPLGLLSAVLGGPNTGAETPLR